MVLSSSLWKKADGAKRCIVQNMLMGSVDDDYKRRNKTRQLNVLGG